MQKIALSWCKKFADFYAVAQFSLTYLLAKLSYMLWLNRMFTFLHVKAVRLTDYVRLDWQYTKPYLE